MSIKAVYQVENNAGPVCSNVSVANTNQKTKMNYAAH